MMKLLALLALAAVVAGECPLEKDIPGVSPANMERLRQSMNPRPNSPEEFKHKMQEWENSLPAAERAAALAHREQMAEQHHAEFLRKGIPGVSAASMDRLRQIMNPRPDGPEAFKQKMDEWMASLPPQDKAAAEAHQQEMRQRGPPGPPPPPPSH